MTEAPVTGTTLGVIRVDGVLGAQAKLFDTPGLLQVRKEMRPRTYRLKVSFRSFYAPFICDFCD